LIKHVGISGVKSLFSAQFCRIEDYTLEESSDNFSGFNRFRDLDPEDYYMSDEGYIVFTKAYHLKRGRCCQSGCKHCPYGFNKGGSALKS